MAKRRARVKTPTRVQASAEFSRKKAKLRAKQWKRRGLMAAAIAFVSYVGIGGWWLHHTGKIDKAQEVASSSFWETTADVGFALKQVYLEGREHADANVVKAAIAVKSGMPILSLSLEEMKTKLEQIPEVKTASVTRHLPDQIKISLTERQPAALWQHEGIHRLVDTDGVVLSREKYPNVGTLPVIVGEDAPKHVTGLIALLDAAPALKSQVVAAMRVGSRRWNVRLQRDITVMLPESKPEEAWKRFATLTEREGLLNKAIRSVDMRMEDRVFILPLEQQQNPITLTTATDT